MTRTQTREVAMHLAFSLGINPRPIDELLAELFEEHYQSSLAEEDDLYQIKAPENQLAYLKSVANGLAEHLVELDFYIEKYAKGWQVGRISRVAVAIMRVCMYEILYMPDIPGGVAINEAVEMAKRYEDPDTVAFINGVLGSFIRNEVTP